MRRRSREFGRAGRETTIGRDRFQASLVVVEVTTMTPSGYLTAVSPQLVPLVGSGGEREGADLQLLDVHGQDAHRRQRRPRRLPRAFVPRQAQVVTLEENLRQRFRE